MLCVVAVEVSVWGKSVGGLFMLLGPRDRVDVVLGVVTAGGPLVKLWWVVTIVILDVGHDC